MTKVLLQPHEDTIGFASILEMLGCKILWWDEKQTPAFDIFHLENPDLVVFKEPCSKALEKCIWNNKTPYMMVKNDGHMEVDSGNTPHINVPIPPLVDHLRLFPVIPEPKLFCDVAYIGSPNDSVLKLCLPIGRFNIKIAGPQHWPAVQHIGDITIEQARQLYSSAKVVYAETVKDALWATACGTAFITKNKDTLQIWNDDINFIVEDDEELVDRVAHFAENNIAMGKEQATEFWNTAIPQHTYQTFIVPLLHHAGFEKLTEQSVELLQDGYGYTVNPPK
jgi:hypothetical protein